MLKIIVWFFKSSQQRSFSCVVSECLFFCSVQRAAGGALLTIGLRFLLLISDYSEKPLLYSRELL